MEWGAGVLAVSSVGNAARKLHGVHGECSILFRARAVGWKRRLGGGGGGGNRRAAKGRTGEAGAGYWAQGVSGVQLRGRVHRSCGLLLLTGSVAAGDQPAERPSQHIDRCPTAALLLDSWLQCRSCHCRCRCFRRLCTSPRPQSTAMGPAALTARWVLLARAGGGAPGAGPGWVNQSLHRSAVGRAASSPTTVQSVLL